MANAILPMGAKPVSDLNGRPWSGAGREYSVPAGDGTAISIGDFVKLVGTSQYINGQTFADVARAATGDVIVGVVVGVCADTRDSLIYRAASTQRRLLVCDDPNTLFEMQQASGSTALTANDIGLNANFVVAAGSTYNGLSGTTIDNTTEATTNTLDLKLVGMPNRADQDPGSAVGTGSANSNFYVRINRHQYVNQVAGV
jgi:hypothetical protein